MTNAQLLISGILLLTLIAFVWGRWRYDLVAHVCSDERRRGGSR